MHRTIYLTTLIIVFGCTPAAQYAWQDSRTPARDDASAELAECRSYAAKQYKPGVPAGEPYMVEPDDFPEGDNTTHGDWRPDRTPFPETSIHTTPEHDVPVDYTGYPGELDYSPHYLDDILEKCMRDRGWRYLPVTEE